MESFLITLESLTARRDIWGIGHSRIYALGSIRSVNAERLKYRVNIHSWWRMFIGHGERQILVDWSGRTYAYGKGLEEVEAGDLVDLLEDEMSYHSHKQQLPTMRSASMI